MHRQPANIQRYPDQITGGASLRRDNGPVIPGKNVEECGFTGVWPTQDRNGNTITVEHVPFCLGYCYPHGINQLIHRLPHCLIQIIGQFFISEINQRFQPGRQIDQLLPPGFRDRAKPAIKLAHGGAMLFGRIGIDHVPDRLSLIEINPAIEERPAGKLARVCEPETGQGFQRLHHHPAQHGAAMQVKFGKVFTGGAVGAGKKHHHAAIKPVAIGVRDGGEGGAARFGQPARHPPQGTRSTRPGDPDNLNSRTSRRCRQGENRFNVLLHAISP